MSYTDETLGQRVRFGSGVAAGVAAEVELLGARRVRLIAAPPGAELARSVSADIDVAVVHDDVRMHVPLDVPDRARAAAAEHDVDAILCVGGGSTTGLVKAVAVTSGLPIVAVPTTYAGSEATNVWGLAERAPRRLASMHYADRRCIGMNRHGHPGTPRLFALCAPAAPPSRRRREREALLH